MAWSITSLNQVQYSKVKIIIRIEWYKNICMNYPYLHIDLTCNIMRNGKQRITGSLGYAEYQHVSMKPQWPAQPRSSVRSTYFRRPSVTPSGAGRRNTSWHAGNLLTILLSPFTFTLFPFSVDKRVVIRHSPALLSLSI